MSRTTMRRCRHPPDIARTATPGGARSASRHRTRPLEHAAESVANFLRATTMEVTALARACGKSDVHHLEPEDLVALTVEAAAMAKLPLAGTDWIPGWPAETER